MLSAILKVSGITAFVLILGAAVVLMTRVNAFRQTAQVPPHAWFEHPKWTFTAPAINPWCHLPVAGAAGEILVLPVRKTPARWEISCDAHLDLAEALAKVKLTDVLFDVEAGVPEDLDNLVDIVNNSGIKRVGIRAASQRAARHLRKKSPQWVFAADDASLLRLRMFTSLYLEPAIDFWPDFAMTDAGEVNVLGAREVAELHRRLKRVVWMDRTHEPEFEVDGRVRY